MPFAVKILPEQQLLWGWKIEKWGKTEENPNLHQIYDNTSIHKSKYHFMLFPYRKSKRFQKKKRQIDIDFYPGIVYDNIAKYGIPRTKNWVLLLNERG